MRPTFAFNRDRAAAILARAEREGVQRRVATFDRACDAAAQVLAQCVAEGLGWPAIRPRLAAISVRA